MGITNKTSKQENVGQPNILGTLLRELPLIPSDIKVGRGSKITPKSDDRIGQG